MPIFKHQVIDDYYSHMSSYVSGPRLTHFHKRALNWLGSTWNTSWRWKIQALWVAPLHVAQLLTFYVAITAQTGAGQIWMGILTAICFVPLGIFWRVVYLDYLVYRLHKKNMVAPYQGVQLARLRDGKQENFADWLYAQLSQDGPYFHRVHPIIDRYLEATAKGAVLYESLGYRGGKAVLGPALDKAADQAYEMLRPIFNEAVDTKQRKEQEEAARIASETAFREGEEARITQQRVSMAIEDMEAFTAGNQALTQS